MKITVVVPTYERPRFVEQTIVSLAGQTLPPHDVIVVDNGGSDETRAVVESLRSRFRHLRYLVEPRLGVSYARNRAAGEARGELLAFIDDDAVASPVWLESLARTLQSQPAAIAVAGRIDLRWSCRSPRWIRGLEGWYGRFDLGDEPGTIDYPLFPFASNLAIRREALLSVGGFPVELGPRGTRRIANEEDGLFRRVDERGWAVLYEPSALVYHWVHTERLSRRYLVGRSVSQGRSEVLVDAMFERSRSRSERARRSVASFRVAVGASGTALARRQHRGAMEALVAAGTSFGRAAQEAALSATTRRGSPAADVSPLAGLTPKQRSQFDADGFVRVPGAFDGSGAMADRIWEHLARRGIDRDDPVTWPRGKAHHLQKLLREPVFVPVGGPVTTGAIDDLLGPGRWDRPEHWGEFLVNFPETGRRWSVPTLWHSDAAYTDPLDPLTGVMVFSFLNQVARHGGGTLVLAGSHRLVARFAAGRPQLCQEKTASARRAFYQSHPLLSELVAGDGDGEVVERFVAGVDIDGLPTRLVELTGEPGDIVLVHPLMAHCVSPNCAAQPRFMRIIRPRVRTTDSVVVTSEQLALPG